MKYRLDIAGQTVEMEAHGTGKGEAYHVTIGNQVYHIRYLALEGGCYHLFVNGRAAEAFVARTEHGKQVFVKGKCFLLRDAHRLLLRRGTRPGLQDGPGEVTPPMPAVVVRILVQEGDLVEKGQGLVVVTAMKMETTLVAPRGGKVKKINAAVNDKVAPGDILVEIEEEEKEEEGDEESG